MIGVVDYRAGNAPSVMYALRRLRLDARIVSRPDEIGDVDRLILPGVGAARATLDSLRASSLIEPLTDRVRDERIPFLGICVGLQILFEHSAEAETDCLGWLRGTVERFPDTDRVPQIGWNAVEFQRPHPLVDGIADPAHCYFVNSYYAAPADAGVVLGITRYSADFCSMLAAGNIAATQFHAEKSGELGLRILHNFADWEPAC
jgi:imidazole glycerol-phosphate synthase subunit HisH